MALAYVLAFCRVSIGLVFAVSFGSKVTNVGAFARTIAQFDILPHRLSGVAALLLLSGELAVALAVAAGAALLPGFILAAALLFVFCVALATALVRKTQTSCNCFGPNEKPISAADIWRNVGFMLCALGGCGAYIGSNRSQDDLSMAEWGLIAPTAAVFTAVWARLGELARLSRQS